MSTTHAPPAHEHRVHVNPWHAAVVVLAAALVALAAWVVIDNVRGDGSATEDATALIDDINTAFTTNDGAAIPSFYATDAVVRSLGQEYVGVQAIQSLASGTWQVERIAPVTTEGDYVTTFVRLSAGDQTTNAVTVYQLADGKVVRQWGFALGETPPFDNAVTP